VTRNAPRTGSWVRSLPTLAILAAAAIGFAALSRLPVTVAVAVALAGVVLSEALRSTANGRLRKMAPTPVLVALGAVALAAPLGALPELWAGVAGVAVLVWIADDPARPAFGAVRGAFGWGLPALAVGLAWVSSFLLPPSAVPVGVAGGLLAAAVVALAYLVRRPELADPGAAATL
jgi:hypothetical protein